MCGRIGAGSLVHGRDLHIRRGDIRRALGRGDSSILPAAVVCKVAAVPPTTTTKPKPTPPDEGVDAFGQPAETPPPEPDQPAPVVLVPSTKPLSLLTPVRRRSRLPSTTPDTADSGETEQQRLDRLYPVGPDTSPDARCLYTILRPVRQPTEDEWRERLANRPRRRSPRCAWSYPSPHTSPTPPTRPSSRSLPSLLFRRRKRPARRSSSSSPWRIAGGLDHPPTLRGVASMPHR